MPLTIYPRTKPKMPREKFSSKHSWFFLADVTANKGKHVCHTEVECSVMRVTVNC